MNSHLRLTTLLSGALAWLALSATASAAPPSVTEAWIRATPPGARTAAAYLTLESASTADRLIGGTTRAAARVEVHSHVAEGGMSRMQRLDGLDLPAGAAVRLEPGGLHLMLIDLVAPLTAGKSVALTLEFASGESLSIEAPVVDARPGAPAAHHSH